jgi:hypothetical protein
MKKLLFSIIALILSCKIFSQVILPGVQNSAVIKTAGFECYTGEIFVVYDFSGTQSNKEESTVIPIASNNQDKLIVFPNPTKGKLYYRKPEDMEIHSIRIYDFSNKIVWESFSNVEEIDISPFPSGIYNVIFNDNPTTNQKILKP